MKISSLFLAVILAILHSPAKSNDLNLNEICQGILFQAIAHPYDRNLFIGCVQGRGTVFGCENIDDVFDEETTSCVNPINLTTTTEVPTTSTEATTTTVTSERKKN